MTSAFLHTDFSSSRLVRLLANFSAADATECRQDFTERLGQWLGIADTIRLSSVHNAISSKLPGPGEPREAQSVAITCLQDEFVRVRLDQGNLIREGASNIGGAQTKASLPQSGTVSEMAADYRSYHRYYLARQRDMESSIGRLRANIREALSSASSSLMKLAVLDSTFEELLCVRERELLSVVPVLLEKRFEQLSSTPLHMLDASALPDDSMSQMPSLEKWLQVFCDELQEILLAELDVRLLPAKGLIDAFGNEVNQIK